MNILRTLTIIFTYIEKYEHIDWIAKNVEHVVAQEIESANIHAHMN